MNTFLSALSALLLVLVSVDVARAQHDAKIPGQGTLAVRLEFPEAIQLSWLTPVDQLAGDIPQAAITTPTCAIPATLGAELAGWHRSVVTGSQLMAMDYSNGILVTGLPYQVTAEWRPKSTSSVPRHTNPSWKRYDLRLVRSKNGQRLDGVYLDLIPGIYKFDEFTVDTPDGVRWRVKPFEITVREATVSLTVMLSMAKFTSYPPVEVNENPWFCLGSEGVCQKKLVAGSTYTMQTRPNVLLSLRSAAAFRFRGCSTGAQTAMQRAILMRTTYAGHENLVTCTVMNGQEVIDVVKGDALQPIIRIYTQEVQVDSKTGNQRRGEVKVQDVRVGETLRLAKNVVFAFEGRMSCLKGINTQPVVLPDSSPRRKDVPGAPSNKKSAPKKVKLPLRSALPAAP